MNTLLKIGTVIAVALGFLILVLVHQAETRRLQQEISTLRGQLAASNELGEENKRLAEQLKTAREALLAERSELMKSRAQAQSLRQLEQENAQLKTKVQRLTNESAAGGGLAAGQEQVAGAPPLPPEAAAALARIDLGALDLVLGGLNRFEMTDGHVVTITPTLLDDGTVLMNIALAVKAAPGREEVIASSRVTAQEGQRVAISVGDRMISLQPTLKLEGE